MSIYDELEQRAEHAMEQLFDPKNSDKIYLKIIAHNGEDPQVLVTVDDEPLMLVLNEELKIAAKAILQNSIRVQ